MFNPLTAPEMTLAIGRVLKDAARGEPGDEWRRGQLLSAYSVARHLAAEQEADPELRRWFSGAVVDDIRASSLSGLDAATIEAETRRIERGESWPELGAAMCAVMACLRDAGTADARALAVRLRSRMSDLCDREVAALAAAGT